VRGVWIGCAHDEVAAAGVPPVLLGRAVLLARRSDPVVAGGVGRGQLGRLLCRGPNPHGRHRLLLHGGHRRRLRAQRPCVEAEEVRQMLARRHGKARLHRVYGRIGHDLGRIVVEFLAPDQPCRLALRPNHIAEAPKRFQAIAFADLGQAGVIGQRLPQIVAEIPAHAEAVRRVAHQLALETDALEEHDQLELNLVKRLPSYGR
jgi:hypothetical protein